MATIKTSLFHVISWSIEATCSKDERKIESNRIKVDVRRATPRAMRQKKTCTESDEWNRDQKKARDILLLSHRLHFEQWNWSFAPSLIHYLQYVFFSVHIHTRALTHVLSAEVFVHIHSICTFDFWLLLLAAFFFYFYWTIGQI